MFGVVREFQAPLGVTHAVRGRFGPSSSSLAVVFARKNSLDIYVVRANLEMARLELLQSTPLGANVVSMAVLRRGSSDLLCVGFDRMRIVLMSWDHDARNWTTDQLLDLGLLLGSKLCSPSSVMRSLDPEDEGRPLLHGMVGDYGDPLIRTDPSGRCMAVLAKKQSAMYVIPLRSEDDQSRADERVVNKSEVFVIDIPTEYEAANIKDFEFLHGTFEPNILILHEPKRTWSGRAAIQRNTCQLLNLSVDIRLKRHTKSWAMDTLPYDSAKIVAVPESAGGGALVLAASLIMQVRHGACAAGRSLNCFGDAYSAEVKGKYDMITTSDNLVECDASHCRFLDYEERVPDSPSGTMQCIALLSLKGGELYFLNVAVGSRNTISMNRAGSTVIASEVVPINERFFVLASRLSDSLLVEYRKSMESGESKEVLVKDNENQGHGDKSPGSRSKSGNRKKRTRTAEKEAEYEMIYGVKPPPESSDEETDDENGNKQSALKLEEKDEGTRGVYDDEDELGWVFNSGPENEPSNVKGSGSGNWALKVKDTLTCFGPGTDMAVGTSPDDVSKLDMVVAGGYAKNGCLAVVHESIRPTNRTEFHVPGCKGVWTLHDPSVVRKEKVERDARNAAISLRNAARRARNTKKHAARKRFKEQAINQLRKEREELRKVDMASTEEQVTDNPTQTANSQTTDLGAAAPSKAEDPENGSVNPPSQPETTMVKSTESPTQANGEKTSDPPKKKAKVHDGTASSAVQNAATSEVSLDNIETDVLLQLEQQAEIEFPLEPEEALEESLSEEGALHSYMLLSTETATTVLKTGVEIEELVDDSADFTTDERTIAAGNVFETHAIVQVVPSGVKIIKDGKTQCEYKMPDSKSFVKRAQVCDPLILLQGQDNRLFVLAAKADLVNEDGVVDEAKAATTTVPEEMFDEYGMALENNKLGAGGRGNGSAHENGLATKPEEKGLNGLKHEVTSYSNFSFSLEFCSSDHPGTLDMVTASFLYKGPLAREVAKDGVLSLDIDDSVVPLETTSLGVDSAPSHENQSDVNSSPHEVKPEQGVDAKDNNVQTEDEDRMLYGDDNQEEEDMMLYGTTDQDATAKEPTLDAGGVGSNRDGDMGTGIVATDGGKSELMLNGSMPTTAPPEKGVMALPTPSQVGEAEGHLLILCRSDGTLQVISPSLRWETVLECPAFFAAPTLVRDSPLSKEDRQNGAYPFASKDLSIDSIAMMELSGSALLPSLSSPILVAISASGIAMIYRAFMSTKSNAVQAARSRLSLHRIVSRDRAAHIMARSLNCASGSTEGVSSQKDNASGTATPLVHFRNIAGRAGVFIGGHCPFFLFAERGYPRIHALSHINTSGDETSIEEYESGQGVLGFTEFHNVKCPRGFISVGKDGMIRIGELPPPSVMNFDAPTPMRKIALRCTPHKVAYHAGSATYGVLASMPTLTTREERLARILQSLEKHDKRHYQHSAAQAEAETGDERANRVPPLFEELHELRVYRPDTWELIKSHKLQKGEVGLAIANMKVDVYKQETVSSGAEIPSSKKGDDGNESPFAASLKMRPKDMLVVGTGHLNGEDASSRGRLLLFEISRQEVGVFTAFQLQLIAEKELFSPVTAVASMEGYVIAGVGPQVSVYKLVGDEIIHLSFAFGQLYCTALASLKQYIVAADMCKSVSFMYFRDRNNSVNFLGKDYEHVTSYATEFLIENENVSVIVSDGNTNIQLMNYAHASVPESQGGKRLLINGGTHFGSRINTFVRTRAPDKKQDLESSRARTKAGRHVLLFTTLDGGIGALVAVNEVEFRNLNKLATEVIQHPGVVRHAGANPLEQTAFRPEAASTVLLQQNVMDSRSVFDIFSVSLVEMRMIARQAGTDLAGLAKTVTTVDSVLYRF